MNPLGSSYLYVGHPHPELVPLLEAVLMKVAGVALLFARTADARGFFGLPSLFSAAPSRTNEYDYSKSTSENHAQADAPLSREFFASRAGLDYSWYAVRGRKSTGRRRR